MPSNRRGLGRGLDALIPTELTDDATLKSMTKVAEGERIEQVAPGQIKPNPHQPRQTFDPTALAELAASIQIHGIVQPLVVSKAGSGYELIAGERRLRAAKQLKIEQVPVIVRSLDEQAKLELALIENVQRADLNPVETAVAYRKLIDQFNLRLEDLAKRVGKSIPAISNTVRLLGLPPAATEALVTGRISEGHARAILAVTDPKQRGEMLATILDQGLSVRQAEHLARGFKLPTANKQGALKHISTQNQWTQQLSQHLGTAVAISRSAKGGKLTIEFASDQDLERISQRLLGS